MNQTTVVLVDDAPDVRGVIAALLGRHGGFEVVGEAGDGVSGVEVVRRLKPDIVLLDLAMPVMDGLTALPLMRGAAPSTIIVVLSAFGTDQTVQAALKAGAAGFIHKGARLPETLLPSLRAVMAERAS